jgi:hypothetical protein
LYTANNKGKWFIYWGGNGANFSKSDIRFQGEDYDFTLYQVGAKQKAKHLHIDYINPQRITIPQTNFRIGYFINHKYHLSFGIDHMKYVMVQDQNSHISGHINLPSDQVGSAFNGTYTYAPIVLTEDFLQFEHTDGLNYINLEIGRQDDVSRWFGINNTDKFQVNTLLGAGGGFLYPKTNTTLMGKERYDAFHASGYGFSAKAGLNLTFLKHFFVQYEFKAGYINMPDIRTTASKADSASQHFNFIERIPVVGGIFRL